MLRSSRLVMIAAGGLFLGLVTPAAGQHAPGRAMVVSADWLQERLGDPGVVILHVGRPETYAAEHIPGARFMGLHTMSPMRGANGLTLELADSEAAQDSLRAHGISNDTRTIVVYWSDEWVTPAARIIFNLDWAGLGHRTVLLQRGIEGWKEAGGPVTSEVPPPRQGDVTVRSRTELVVDAFWVQANATKRGFALVDGRARAFYDGVRTDRDKAGHIPGAGSVPWTELVDESLRLKSREALRSVFTAGGVAPGDTVVAYCHIGQYATMVLLAARTLGHPVKLYDGAFQDWAARDLPVETGSDR